ncbi:MAG: Ig domain-containing protein [Angelakisella sp.]
MTLDQTTMELTVNGTGKLTATVKPDETTVKTIQWSSSDEAVATVGADGTVTALKEGYGSYHGEVWRKERRMHGDCEGGSSDANIHYHGTDKAEPDGGTEIHPNSHNIAGECNQ